MKDKALRKDIVWNTLGSLLYAISSMILAFFVMRVMGADEGGIFGFGYSTFGHQIFIIAYFGIRPFQITDVSGEYSFSDYKRARQRTCFYAAAFALIYLAALAACGKYSLRKSIIIMLLALMKTADGLADVYESECQRRGVLYRGGRELFIRTLLSQTVLMASLLIFKDLVLSALLAVLMHAAAIFVFSRSLKSCGVTEEDPPGSERRDGKLLMGTSLLFLSVFLDFYVFSSSKYAIDIRLTDSMSGVFNILFMPTSVIYLMSNFIIKPFMTRMAESLEKGDEKGFFRTKRKLTLYVAGLTALCTFLAVLFGSRALGIAEHILGGAFRGLLKPRAAEFVLMIFGGGLYALANLYYYILVMKRKQKRIFIIYLIAACLAAALSVLLTGSFGLTGAAVSYAALMSLLLFGFAVSV